jgi:hypothetical protein
MQRSILPAAFTLLALTVASRALASDPYPELIKQQLLLEQPPLCTICHETLIGGLMTINKPMGRTLQQKYGLRFQDPAGLRAAIMRMQENGDDSDGDRISDTAELQQGTDPNVPQGGAPLEEARYGCYCSAVGGSPSFGAGAAWLSGFALAMGRRRRARLRPTERDT